MTTKETYLGGSAFFMPRHGDTQMGMRPAFLPVFEAEGGAGGGGGEGGAGGAGGGKGGSGGGTGGPTAAELKAAQDEAARLARELAKTTKTSQELAEQVKKFEGVDPAKFKELLTAHEQAEAAQRKAEEDRLKAAGDFEALKKRMADEHESQMKALKAQLTEKDNGVSALQKQIVELTVGQGFAASQYVVKETILTPSKARALYGSHFEVKDGATIAYDRPATDSAREPLVDARGKPLPFDQAIQRIIEADPDKDHLLRSKVNKGSGTGNQRGASEGSGNGGGNGGSGGADDGMRGLGRIAGALAGGALQSAIRRK